jgi:hypothetical protein
MSPLRETWRLTRMAPLPGDFGGDTSVSSDQDAAINRDTRVDIDSWTDGDTGVDVDSRRDVDRWFDADAMITPDHSEADHSDEPDLTRPDLAVEPDTGVAWPEHPAVPDFIDSVPRTHLPSFESGREPVVWSEAGYLEALLEMYRATRDVRLLDEMVVHLDVLAANTGAARGLVDVVRGEPVSGWPTERYSCGQLFTHAVHTGILSFPMAWFVRTSLSEPALTARFADRLDDYLDIASAAVAVHDAQFRVSGETGWYRRPADYGALGSCDGTNYADQAGDPLPFNMMLALGRAHIELGRAFEHLGEGDDSDHHLDGARQLGAYFLDQLAYVADGDRYTWLYSLGGRPEDTSHGALDIRFVTHAHAEGLGFSPTHMTRLANTFTGYLAADPAAVESHLDPDYGSGPDRRWQQGAVRWMNLAATDREVYDLGRWIYHNHEGDTLLGRALLARWRDPDWRYPAFGQAYLDLPVHRLHGGAQPSRSVGLYRPSGTPLYEIGSASISSCAHYTFEAPVSTLVMRYRHTSAAIAGDSCSGESCGTAVSPLLFVDDGSGWVRVSGLDTATTDWAVVSATLDAPSTDVMLCRGGAGHARDNLQVSYVRVAR